jgi:UDP-N-acetylmuramyl pentapeptide phosphotransferase/UDP-N-acetylglucosamine-1-phosphate transferase
MFGSLLISISLLGSLIPFFIYNVFGKKNKLFMGDTGALIIGVISVVLVVKFNELSVSNSTQYILTAAPAMSIAILFIPLYDTLQVFVIRVFNKRSPFSPDKNHLHHRLLNLGLNHIQTSSILITLNAIIIISSYLMQSIGIFALTVLLLLIGLMFSTFLWYLAKRKKLV